MRTIYQAAYVWGQTMVTQPDLPSPGDWGWQHTYHSWPPKTGKTYQRLVKCIMYSYFVIARKRAEESANIYDLTSNALLFVYVLGTAGGISR